MKLLDLIFGKNRREALIKANTNVSKETQAEEANDELFSWLREKNGRLSVPVK